MQRRTRAVAAVGSLIATLALSWIGASSASAQESPLMQQKVAEIRASLAKNEQMVGQYTWQQQEAISVRGDLKKEALCQVQLGANGQPVRTDISQSQPASGASGEYGTASLRITSTTESKSPHCAELRATQSRSLANARCGGRRLAQNGRRRGPLLNRRSRIR